MGWTKGQFIDMGFEEIGFANYRFDLPPERLQSALVRLDSMMAEWDSQGLRLGYPLPSTQTGSRVTEDTEVAAWANYAIYTNLALRLADMLGKEVKPALQSKAHAAYENLTLKFSEPPRRQWPAHLPAGAGNKQWNGGQGPFLTPPTDSLDVGGDSELEFS